MLFLWDQTCAWDRSTIQVERRDGGIGTFFRMEQGIHDCLRCADHLPSKCRCKHVCKSVLACKKHTSPSCAECEPSSMELRDIHSVANRTFSVYDKTHGFRPEFRLHAGNSLVFVAVIFCCCYFLLLIVLFWLLFVC